MVRQSTGNATCPATYHTNSPISTILGCDSLHSPTHYCRMQLDSFGCRGFLFLSFSLVFSHRKPLKTERKRSMIVVDSGYALQFTYRGIRIRYASDTTVNGRFTFDILLDTIEYTYYSIRMSVVGQTAIIISISLTFSFAHAISIRFGNVKRY